MKTRWLPFLCMIAITLFHPGRVQPLPGAICQSCGGGGGGSCLGGDQFTSGGGDSGYSPDCSPIIIDTSGHGFHLTSADDGVRFDMSGNGTPVQIAWTASGSDNAFLVLPDKNGNVLNGKALFGNFTPQPYSADPNGFLALAVYDQAENGGNGDGVISSKDTIFSALRLWIDSNHDGIAQPQELFTLPALGLDSITLTYTEALRVDQFGNEFRYKGHINGVDHSKKDFPIDRTIYDVFLTARSAR